MPKGLKVKLVGLALKPQAVGVPDVYKIGDNALAQGNPATDLPVSEILFHRSAYSKGNFGDGPAYQIRFEGSNGRHVVKADDVAQLMLVTEDPNEEPIGEIPD